MIFTGNKGRKPDIISLSQEFFDGEDIEVKAKVIYESDKDDIINQYIIFCKVFNEQTKQHGMTRKDEVSIYFPELLENDIKEIEAEVMQLV